MFNGVYVSITDAKNFPGYWLLGLDKEECLS